jgi:hypothetical protein
MSDDDYDQMILTRAPPYSQIIMVDENCHHMILAKSLPISEQTLKELAEGKETGMT